MPGDDADPPAARPLDYQRRPNRRAATASFVVGTAVIGFFTWVFAVALWVAVGAAASGAPPVLWGGGGLILAGVAWLGWWQHTRHGWRGFVPGLLLGFLLTCLVPVGIVAVVCGPLGSKW